MAQRYIIRLVEGSTGGVVLPDQGHIWLKQGNTGPSRLVFTDETNMECFVNQYMDEIKDVEITSIMDGDILVYDNSTSKWINVPPNTIGITGPTGPTGPVGPIGNTGPQGVSGNNMLGTFLEGRFPSLAAAGGNLTLTTTRSGDLNSPNIVGGTGTDVNINKEGTYLLSANGLQNAATISRMTWTRTPTNGLYTDILSQTSHGESLSTPNIAGTMYLFVGDILRLSVQTGAGNFVGNLSFYSITFIH
jgi:hypothetical protein